MMQNLKKLLYTLLLAGGLIALVSAAVTAEAAAPKTVTKVVLTKDNSITLNAPFYGDTVAALVKEAKELDSRTDSNDPIYLILNSPGGSIDAGLELISTLNGLKRPVKTISLFSASMGFQTVQGLNGERLMVKDGTLMSHKASGGFYGEFPGQLDSRYSYYLKRIKRMDEKVVERSGGKQTLKSYAALIENEFWCDGEDCIAQGFADAIVNPACDKSLEGVKSVVEDRFIFSGHVIEFISEYDKCPLNTNALKWNILIDGEPLFKEANKATTSTNNNGATNAGAGLGSFGPYPYFGNLYQGTTTSGTNATLTAEQLFEVQQKLKKVQEERSSRKVIKGY